MESKFALILILAVVICQTSCDPTITSQAIGAKSKLTSGLSGAKDKVTTSAKSAKTSTQNLVSDTKATATSTIGGTKDKLTSKAVKGLTSIKRDVAHEEEDLHNESGFTPEDIYAFVEERYPHMRGLFEGILSQIEPEDEEEPESK